MILIGGGEPTLYPGFADFVGYPQGRPRSCRSRSSPTAAATTGCMAVVRLHSERGRLGSAVAGLRQSNRARSEAMHKPVRRIRSTSTRSAAGSRRSRRVNPAASRRSASAFIITWKGATSRDDTKRWSRTSTRWRKRRGGARPGRSSFDYIGVQAVPRAPAVRAPRSWTPRRRRRRIL